jgi:hypothetical protein
VFADFGQPQRHRGYVSPIIYQTEPPILRNHNLGQTPTVSDAEARGARMEKLAVTGLLLSATSLGVYLWTINKMTHHPVSANKRRASRRRRSRHA